MLLRLGSYLPRDPSLQMFQIRACLPKYLLTWGLPDSVDDGTDSCKWWVQAVPIQIRLSASRSFVPSQHRGISDNRRSNTARHGQTLIFDQNLISQPMTMSLPVHFLSAAPTLYCICMFIARCLLSDSHHLWIAQSKVLLHALQT